MALSHIQCVSLVGLDALPVEVEVDVAKADKPYVVIVGLPDTAVRESKDRVLTAIKNTGFSIGSVYCTVNLAPGDLKKEGVIYDLPIAIGLLHSSGLMPTSERLSDYLIVGELSLSGQLRPISGALAIAMLARELGKKGIILPSSHAEEAAAVPGIDVFGMESLKQTVDFFKSPQTFQPTASNLSSTLFAYQNPTIDFADIKGQVHVKRAMEIAAAGAHNIVLYGPPGSGKTMIAKALAGIIPELTLEEALEITRIHSIAGLLKSGQSMVLKRPFRSPHHTVSYAGLIGGGTIPRPGEVSLAHHGVLFLDELPEFSRSVLEVLRQPLEDRTVTISRANGHFTFPTNFMCVAAMNPCPCGYLGHPDKPCKDTETQVNRYRGKISGPLWDRLDMHIEVPSLRYEEMTSTQSNESSLIIRERVKQARLKQYRRLGETRTNSNLTSRELKTHCLLDQAGLELIRLVVDRMGISARGCDRLIRVARTIADLDGQDFIQQAHLMEAINFRGLTK